MPGTVIWQYHRDTSLYNARWDDTEEKPRQTRLSTADWPAFKAAREREGYNFFEGDIKDSDPQDRR